MQKNTIDRLQKKMLHAISPDDKQKLDEWKSDTLPNAQLYEAITGAQQNEQIEAIGETMREEIFSEVNRRIQASLRRTFWLRIGAVAASVAILLGVTNYLSFQQGYRRIGSQQVELSNPLGMQSSVVLADGTKVILNAGTTLSYPTAFTTDTREVKICGEAYFEVAPDRTHPFIVKAENVNIKVLGTQFNVKAYPEENNIEITLAEGKVSVGMNEKPDLIYMRPNQQVCFDKTKRQFSKKQVNLPYYTAWKEGKFHFNSLTFREISTQLERRFNVDIQIGSPALEKTVFTGDFIRGENLEQILHVMTADKRMRYKIDGDQVLIFEK